MASPSMHILEMPDRALPASVDAERSILGGILLDNHAFFEAAEGLRPEDFCLDSHRRIFSQMRELAASSEPIDTITLIEGLGRSEELDSVGGVGYVAGLIDGVPDRPSLAHYIKIVKGKSLLRGLISAAEVAIARAVDCEPVAEIVSGLLETILDVESQSGKGRAVTARAFMPEVLRELEVQAQAGGLVGLPWGLAPLDELTGGARPGELVVVAALPGGAKTAFAGQIIAANAEAGNPVGVFSIEMSRWDLGRRFLSGVTPVSAAKIRHPKFISKDEWPTLAAGAAEIAEWPVWFDDSGTISLPELLARARLFITRMKAKLLVVDYLQLVRADAREIRERVARVADGLRQLAKAERVSVVLLSQLRRPQNVNDVPTIIDLKESGDIEAHAHVVLLLHSPVAADGRPTGEDTIIIGKNRNGSKGPVPVTFSTHKLRFYPRTVDSRSQSNSGQHE
jgi:replicative DNA helicase